MTGRPVLDSDFIPEGLHIQSGQKVGELVIADAQDHIWVTLHDGANGDPEQWRRTIANLVCEALQLEEFENADVS